MLIPTTSYVATALQYRGIAFGGLSIYPKGTPPDPSWPWYHAHATSGDLVVVYGLAPADQPTAATVIDALVLVPQTLRALYEIQNDVQALTATQSNNVWNDLRSGSPAKMIADEGPNTAAIWVQQFLSSIGSLSTTERNRAQQQVITLYTQDNPFYLIRPSYDNSINISGYRPA